MGWWKIHNTEDTVGDDPFDILGEATRRIAEEYERELGRLPTCSEWQHLIEMALQPIEDVEASVPGEPPPVRFLLLEKVRPKAVLISLGNEAKSPPR
jgi:hypothetical protein